MLIQKLLEIQAMLKSNNIEAAQKRIKYLLKFFSKEEQDKAALGIMKDFRGRKIQTRKRAKFKKTN